MSLPNNRRRDPGGMGSETVLLFVALGLVVVGGGLAVASVVIGHAWRGSGQELPQDIFEVGFGLLSGKVEWPGWQGWVVFAGISFILLAATLGGFLVIGASRRKRTRVDRAARVLGVGKDVEELRSKTARAKAARLGVAGSLGVMIGRLVSTGEAIYGSWEDMHVDIWGPRTGKTTSRAVPAILDAPGAVLVTSNKRDIVDATRDIRAESGEVWVFDPQGIALEQPNWWWNPLSYVTDEVRAAKLAEHFAVGSRDANARADAFFDGAGMDLFAGILLAAALDGRSITDAYRWLTTPKQEPVDILKDHGFDLISDQVAGVVDAPDKQRAGIYATAMQMAACLTNRQIVAWVTPHGPEDQRKQFDPHEFVRGSGTLFSLSKEGRGTAGPLVTALTVAVVEAAEELAASSAGGRLKTPLLGVLDEAANVCRWRDLPSLYSHFGSRGIVLMTILQSWSQGVEVWGESGMKKLWSAANVKVYGGGVSERAFLEDLSTLIGDREYISSSTSTGRGQRSVSHQRQRERILDVAELASMPKGRAVVLASGSRPTLVRTVPWMVGQHAEAVKASIRAHDPMGGVTVAAADASLALAATEGGEQA